MKSLNRRQFIGFSVAAGVASSLPFSSPAKIALGANDRIRMGILGCGVRGNEHLAGFNGMPEVDVVAIADPDESRVEKMKTRFENGVKAYADLRKILDDKEIDAVVITTCDHWHCLAAIWAMQAGKDVYVEKPLAHNIWEGRQTLAAARKYDRVCQVGMQQRSDKMQAEIKKFLHEEKALGEIKYARVNHYSPRKPIGKNAQPLQFPANVDKNLWLGPAADLPMYRNQLQYDWHWMWNTGTGEMGNWGVHVLDDCRNNVLLDVARFPKRILAGGVRAGYNDDGETPNIHFVYFDTEVPVMLGLSTLGIPDSKSAGDHPGPGSGYIAYCEGGRLEGQRGSAKAVDNDGNVIKTFKGNSGQSEHQRAFIDAVLSRDRSGLLGEIAIGEATSEWCNMANIAFRCGKTMTKDRAAEVANVAKEAGEVWPSILESAQKTLAANDVPMLDGDVVVSDMLTFDAEKEAFVGDGADAANALMKREYRGEFVVPEIA